MKKSLVRAGLLGVGMAVVTKLIEYGHRAMGYELDFTAEDVVVLSLAVVIGFRDWIAGRKGND